MHRVAVHPLLIGAYAVVFLWSQNAQEVTFATVVGPLGVVIASVAVVYLVIGLILRDHRRAAVATSGLVFLFLSYGHVWAVGNRIVAEHAILLAIWGLLAAAVMFAAVRLPRLADATRVLNWVTLGLLMFAAVPLVDVLGSRDAHPRGEALAATDLQPAPGRERDIYYIILDRYGRADSLRELFGYDNGPFLRFLERQGFDVAQRSVANYPRTAHSLAVSLNLRYLDDVARRVGPESGDWAPTYHLLRNHEVGRTLTSNGYRYIHLGTWWDPTATSTYADVTLRYGQSSEFAEVLKRTTPIPALRAVLGLGGDGDTRILKRNSTLYQFAQLERLARERSTQPRFVFAHLTIPHEPYVFSADGSLVSEAEEEARTRTENYVGQVEFANRRLRELVRLLLAGPPERDPIVILQADEGPHPLRYMEKERGFVWARATTPELREKLRILNAYYLPGLSDDPIYPTITPVNTFRLIFDRYFGTHFGLLPDEAYVYRSGYDLYDFTKVTDRVR